jgi:hypothetical protein
MGTGAAPQSYRAARPRAGGYDIEGSHRHHSIASRARPAPRRLPGGARGATSRRDVLTNLLRPWILARLSSGVAASLLALVGLVVAWQVLRYWRVGRSSEGQLALERRAELVATVVQVALGVAILDLLLTVLAADRLTHSIRGAMCAWGVFDASPWGFRALASSTAAAAACAFWVLLHRLDLRLARPTLTRRKFAALFVVVPLLWLDLGVTAAFFLNLDLSVLATCCSVGLDDEVARNGGAGGGARLTAALGALALGVGAAAAASRAGRGRPGPLLAWLAALLSGTAAAFALPAIVGYVAPHVYETPHHLCPFCLLHLDDAGGLGWPLFAGLFAATITGVGLGVLEMQRGASEEPAEVSAFERRLGRASALLWLATVALGLAPVLRYAWVTGGASLF